MQKKTEKELNQPLIEAMKLHEFYQGKIEMNLKCPVRSYQDFAIWYTPGAVSYTHLDVYKRQGITAA